MDAKGLDETTDPRALIPGSPDAIDENERAVRARGETMGRVGDGLRNINTGDWRGEAADAFHERTNFLALTWLTAADSFLTIAKALEIYASVLRWAQAKAHEAVILWKQGEAATARAKTQHEAVVDEHNANLGSGDPTPEPFSDPGEAYRQAAREMLHTARLQVQQAGDESAQVIRHESKRVPRDGGEGFWGGLGHTALDLAGFVPGVGEIADGVNAAWYAAEGKTTEAALSGAAAIPFVGWLSGGSKIGKRAKAVFGYADTKNYRKTFFDAHPELQGRVVVHHAVEQKAAKLYESAKITPNEMHSLENLRGIPKDANNKLHLSDIRKEWDVFYRKYPNATKEELLEHATKVDDNYGHKFWPPVR